MVDGHADFLECGENVSHVGAVIVPDLLGELIVVVEIGFLLLLREVEGDSLNGDRRQLRGSKEEVLLAPGLKSIGVVTMFCPPLCVVAGIEEMSKAL